MDTPQDRVIKKMINNIVETNRPVFEKTAPAKTSGDNAPAEKTSGASTGAAMETEDYNLISRKIEYGFNNLRQENAAMRKQLEELGGALKMLRNDMDTVRMAMRSGNSSPQPSHAAAPAQASSQGNVPAGGAPQYKQTEADKAYEAAQGSNGGENAQAAPQQEQARGFKKEDPQVDISKVFYYGKK
jgi:hypothetical protein